MKIIKQLCIIFALCMAGEIISYVLPFSFPGSIIGLLILLMLFVLKIMPKNAIDETGDFLLGNMAIFFIPASISLMTVMDMIAENILAIIIICCISTIATFLATAYTVKLVVHIQNKLKEKQNG